MKRKKWIATLGIGLLGNYAMTHGFNMILYPFIIYTYGVLVGGIIMAVLSFILCYLTILFYDWAKRDWLGLETLKEIRESQPDNVIGHFFAKFIKKNNPAAMIFLSIKFDPFITVAYLRHGAHIYDGLSKRDWKIFIASFAISNLYWIFTVYMGITIIEALWPLILKILIT